MAIISFFNVLPSLQIKVIFVIIVSEEVILMGRELRRKQAKKDGKELKIEKVDESDKASLRDFARMVAILAVIGCLVYILSGLFITRELNWFSDKDNANTQTNAILASATFRQNAEEYYVYFYNFNEDKAELTTAVEKLSEKNTLYRVDTSSDLNANYIGDKGNNKATTLDELKVVSPTLIKIVDGKIVEYYENSEIYKAL